MKIYYDFEDCIVPFEFEIDKAQIVEFLVDKMLDDSHASKTKDSVQALKYTIEEFCLWDDNDLLYDCEDEMREYFEPYARDCWEDSKCYEEDEKDWFGTKKNVIGL